MIQTLRSLFLRSYVSVVLIGLPKITEKQKGKTMSSEGIDKEIADYLVARENLKTEILRIDEALKMISKKYGKIIGLE